MSKQSMLAVLSVLLGAQTASAGTTGAYCETRATLSTSAPLTCRADDQSCRSWRKFREGHPFPFQSLSVELLGRGEAVVIISEPPPVAPPDELRAFSSAVFGDGASNARLRLPIGQDGWLDDLVFHVKGLEGPQVGFPTADGGTIEIPSSLADRLSYLSLRLFGTEDMAYVDRLSSDAGVPPFVDDLRFDGSDVNRVVADGQHAWSEVGQDGASRVPFGTLQKSATPGAWVDDVDELVAFVAPKRIDVQKTKAAFRRFALLSDQLVGAVGPTSGGMILLGRNRRIPLSSLPPLRFETLEMLASSLGKPLAQSYERTRSYAGKISTGAFAGWDWAPAYLSPQLEDTEFGVLLNLADQQLKSWSEHGDVRYAAFRYPQPKSYPFGSEALSTHLSKEKRTPTIIFNWNTNGYGSETESDAGRLVFASNTTALPVSYIVGRGGEQDDAELDLDADASKTGSKYFASVGDPILARVARNVFLYQAVSAIKPFGQKKNEPVRATKRSAAVSDVLVRETTQWLTARATGTDKDGAVVALLHETGLPAARFAKLMAAPETSTQEVVGLTNSLAQSNNLLLEANQRRIGVAMDLMTNAPLAEAEFTSRCATTPVRTTDGLSCSMSPYSFKGMAERRQDELRGKLRRLDSEVAGHEKRMKRAMQLLERAAAQRKAAAKAVELLDSEEMPRFGAVFEDVLEAAQNTASKSFIQTPSIVLSCSADNFFVVGGHSIDALPERPLRVGSTFSIPEWGKKSPPREPLPAPTRGPAQALGIEGKAPQRSFLDIFRKRDASASLGEMALKRAEICNCDVYVERGDSGIATLVETRPPPKVTQVFGPAKLVEKLAERKGGERIVFAGYEPHSVSSFTRAASVKAKSAGHLPIGEARRLFEVPEMSASTTLRTSASGGKPMTVGANSLSALKNSLAERPSWKDSSILPGAAGGKHLIEVNVGENVGDLSIKVYAYDHEGNCVVSTRLSDIATAEFRAANDATVKEAVNKVGKRLTQDSSVQEVEFFLKNVGKVMRYQKGGPDAQDLRLTRAD